jgi:signal transduction histidine kinase
VLFAISALVLLACIYYMTVDSMGRQIQTVVEADSNSLMEHYRRGGMTALMVEINERAKHDHSGYTLYALLLPASPKPVAGNLKRWPRHATGEGWLTFDIDDHIAKGYSDSGDAWAQIRVLNGNERLLVGRNIEDLDEMRALINQALAWGLGVTAVLGLLSGIALSFGTLRRLEAINKTSKAIMHGDLSQRIPVTGQQDDINQLAVNLNQMLDRIQGLMENVRQVSNDIAHDLRTPLTRLRVKLEKMVDQASDPKQHRSIVEAAIAEVEGMLTTFNALLRIAQIESGTVYSEFNLVDLGAVAADAVELYEPLAANKGQYLTTKIASNIRIWGDRDLLFQAIVNLLDNALKYTNQHGRIDVSVNDSASGGAIVIADNGPGVPENERERVLKRFVRLQKERGRSGSGLGLSLVAAIAKLHHGTLELADNAPGLRISLTVPHKAD